MSLAATVRVYLVTRALLISTRHQNGDSVETCGRLVLPGNSGEQSGQVTLGAASIRAQRRRCRQSTSQVVPH